MDFSWFGITVIDIGIVSIGVIGFAWLFRRIAILERENGKLQAEVNTLTKENQALQEEFEKECQKLKAEFEQENGALRQKFEQENGALRQKFEQENGALRQDLNVMAARYAEIKEMLTLLLKRENAIE